MQLKESKIFKFFPTKHSWEKKLNAIECFYSGMFPMSCLYFKGKLDLARFKQALQETLEAFDFLFCRLHTIEQQLYAKYTKEQPELYFVQLEVEQKTKSIAESHYAENIPHLLESRQSPMAAFKLTYLKDGFVIGYCFNHAFADQASIVYFFKSLAACYSSLPWKAPYLIDIEKLEKAKQVPVFKTVLDLRCYAEEHIGFKFLSDQKVLEASASLLPIYLYFNQIEMEEILKTSTSFISQNDVVHAVLLKIYGSYPEWREDQTMRLGFACNMRKRMGLGEEAIGNLGRFCCMDSLSIAQARKSSFTELAHQSRLCVNQISLESYKNELEWFRQLQAFDEKAQDYVPLPYVDPLFWGHTNWASFPYHTISFEEALPVGLGTPILPASIKFSLMSFDYRLPNSSYVVFLNIPAKHLSFVEEWGKASRLYYVL